MSNKGVAVEGDVGQVVAGKVVHEGARTEGHFSNVINMGGAASAPEPRYITWQQDKAIKARVDELMPVLGKDRLEIYEEIFNEYSVSRRAEIPSNKFKSVMEMLDQLEAKATGATESPREIAEHGPLTCGSCAQLRTRLRRIKAVGAVAVITAFASVGVAIYFSQAAIADAQTDSAPVSQCQFEGQMYSPGSVVKMPNGQARECLDAGGNKSMQWAVPSQPAWKRPR
ncbi:protein of unknown function [Cupriavidus taiwanensis]|uniref:Uncharacterized protein n=1 Tax=Cupriavidus taiwanensis TaxID=164546 RepID=A0A375IHP3_9BURK|nr:hypothetical protein [Cupriavidus taiwanensis]SPK73069.1 protein of unknown function [Cupriavidus taiwanensis]